MCYPEHHTDLLPWLCMLQQQLEERGHAGLELHDLPAKLDKSLLSRKQARANAVEERERAGLELHNLRAKLDKSLLSRGVILSITYPFDCG